MSSMNGSRNSYMKRSGRKTRPFRPNPAYRPRVEDHLFAKVTDADDYSEIPKSSKRSKYAVQQQREGCRHNPIMIEDDESLEYSPQRSPSPDHIPIYARGWFKACKNNSSVREEDDGNLDAGKSARTGQAKAPEPLQRGKRSYSTMRDDAALQSRRNEQVQDSTDVDEFEYNPNDRDQARYLDAMKYMEENIHRRERANK